jgi:putative Mg2+ transporter-C (MgtC) family protein
MLEILNFDFIYTLNILIKLTIAFTAGILIGYDREKRRMPAGIKTHTLVCIGSCLVMMTGEYTYLKYGQDDVTRLAAQVISGLGFLGAGTILVTKNNRIKGLTTAASLWFTGCLGITIGIGFYEAAVISLIAVLIVMKILNKVDDRIYANLKIIQLHMLIPSLRVTNTIYEKLDSLDCEILSVNPDLHTNHKGDGGFVYFNVTIKIPLKLTHPELLEEMSKLDEILFVELM